MIVIALAGASQKEQPFSSAPPNDLIAQVTPHTSQRA